MSPESLKATIDSAYSKADVKTALNRRENLGEVFRSVVESGGLVGKNRTGNFSSMLDQVRDNSFFLDSLLLVTLAFDVFESFKYLREIRDCSVRDMFNK